MLTLYKNLPKSQAYKKRGTETMPLFWIFIHSVFKLCFYTFANSKLAKVLSTESKLASVKSAFIRQAPWICAHPKLAFLRFAPIKLAFPRLHPWRLAFSRFAPLRFALRRSQPFRVTPWRSWPSRAASVKDMLILEAFSKASFMEEAWSWKIVSPLLLFKTIFFIIKNFFY